MLYKCLEINILTVDLFCINLDIFWMRVVDRGSNQGVLWWGQVGRIPIRVHLRAKDVGRFYDEPSRGPQEGEPNAMSSSRLEGASV